MKKHNHSLEQNYQNDANTHPDEFGDDKNVENDLVTEEEEKVENLLSIKILDEAEYFGSDDEVF